MKRFICRNAETIKAVVTIMFAVIAVAHVIVGSVLYSIREMYYGIDATYLGIAAVVWFTVLVGTMIIED